MMNFSSTLPSGEQTVGAVDHERALLAQRVQVPSKIGSLHYFGVRRLMYFVRCGRSNKPRGVRTNDGATVVGDDSSFVRAARIDGDP